MSLQNKRFLAKNATRRAGLEPATVGLEIRCSIRLSYRRLEEILLAEDDRASDGWDIALLVLNPTHHGHRHLSGAGVHREGGLATPESTLDRTESHTPGIGARFDQLLATLTDTVDGTIQLRLDAMDQQINLGNRRIEQLDDQLDAKRARLEAQFLAMELAIAQIQGQSNALLSLQALAASTASFGR